MADSLVSRFGRYTTLWDVTARHSFRKVWILREPQVVRRPRAGDVPQVATASRSQSIPRYRAAPYARERDIARFMTLSNVSLRPFTPARVHSLSSATPACLRLPKGQQDGG
jgi:hypothetical protein